MAQIDSSLYFQQQSPDITGSIQKGLQMADLIQQRQIQRKELQKQNDLKAAFSAGVTLNPDGSINHDSTKTMAAIANLAKDPNSAVSGQDLVQAQQQFATQGAQQAEAKKKKEQDDATYAFQALDPAKFDAAKSPEAKQALWTQTIKQAIADGHQEAAQLPPQYDPSIHQQLLGHAKMVALGPSQFVTDQRLQQTHEDSVKDRGLKAQELRNNKQIAELDKVGSRLEQMRGSPAAAQAEKDIYAAQKVNSLVNLYGDPDKLDPQQVQLVASEVAKIATGGVPTTHEMQGLNPSTIPSGLASISQTFLNTPTPANKGKFITAMKDYTDSLTKDAKEVINDRYGRILKPYESMYKDHPVYKGFQDQYLNRFKDAGQPATDPNIDGYAKQHGLDYGTARTILKGRGYNGQ